MNPRFSRGEHESGACRSVFHRNDAGLRLQRFPTEDPAPLWWFWWLEQPGYRVLEAGSALQAVSVAASQAWDLLLTDLVMPGLNGRDLAGVLATGRPGLKVLFTTGYGDQPESQRVKVDRRTRSSPAAATVR